MLGLSVGIGVPNKSAHWEHGGRGDVGVGEGGVFCKSCLPVEVVMHAAEPSFGGESRVSRNVTEFCEPELHRQLFAMSTQKIRVPVRVVSLLGMSRA